MSAQEQAIKRMIDARISEMESRINARISDAINKLKIDMRNEIKHDNPQNNNQLAVAKDAVRTIMERDYVPKIQAAIEDLREKTQDGDTLITEYRKRVVGGEAHKLLTNTSSGDFRSRAFVFKEGD